MIVTDITIVNINTGNNMSFLKLKKKNILFSCNKFLFLYAGCYIPRSRGASAPFELIENINDVETCQRICQNNKKCLAAAYNRVFFV